jgi:hypothetical protein
MLEHLILGLSFGLGLTLGIRLARAISPWLLLGLWTIVVWVGVLLIVAWEVVSGAVGLAWDWLRD